MALWNSIKMAFKSLWSSKMRTFLTMLGVIIGVTTVALLTTVTNGATQTIMDSLGAESRLVTLLTQNSNKPFTRSKFSEALETLENQETTGEFIVTAVTEANIDVDKGTHLVDISSNIGGEIQTVTMRIGTKVRGVDSTFLDVRNIEIDGSFVSADNECVVDREFIDTYLDGKENSEILGQTVLLGGSLEKLIYSFSSPNRADIDEFYTALCRMFLPNETVPTAPADGVNVELNGGVYTYTESTTSISRVKGYALSTIKEQVKAQIDARNYDFNENYSVEVAEEFTGEKAYKIVGVLIEEDKSLMGSGSSTDGLSNMGSGALSALVEYAKTKKGNVYVNISDHNASLFGDYTSADEIGLSGAYFLFENEEDIDASVLNISTAMISQGYELFKDCYIIPMNTVTQIMGVTMDIMTVLFTVIAAISLVVGGIGIMNIMLVAVSERTREIGIRKAIGAKRSSILLQFLIEALVVSVIGGLLGLLISFVASIGIGFAMGITLSMPLWVILMSLGFCGLIGVCFGMYPAIKASKLQPIDALHRD